MAALRQGDNDLYTWCKNNGERGQRLLDEYMKEKNFDEFGKIISEFARGSHTKVWWKCSKCGFEWKADPHNRIGKNSNCIACNGGINTVIKGINDLETWCKKEENIAWGELLLKEWDYEANADEGNYIDTVSYGSNKKVHWICSNEKCNEKFEMKLVSRTLVGCRCNKCNSQGTSYPEQFIYWSLKQIYKTTENRSKQFKTKEKPLGYEYDIWIPEINTAIEYSGEVWHLIEGKLTPEQIETKKRLDEEKREKAISEGIKYIEIIEAMDNNKKPECENQYIIQNKNVSMKELKNLIRIIFKKESKHIDFIEAERQAIAHSRGKVEEEKQLQNTQPDLCKEWDYEKNKLTPEYYTQGSPARIHWICLKCKKEFDVKIIDRVHSKSGCINCGYNVFENKVKKNATRLSNYRAYKRQMQTLSIIDMI